MMGCNLQRRRVIAPLVAAMFVSLAGCKFYTGDYLGTVDIEATAEGQGLELAFAQLLAIGQQLKLQRSTGWLIDGDTSLIDYCGTSFTRSCADEFARMADWNVRE